MRDKHILRGVLSGDLPDGMQIQPVYTPVMTRWISLLRGWFKGHVIRRTVNSADDKGRPILGLRPYYDIPILCQMFDHERANLEAISAELAEDDSGHTLYGAGRVRCMPPAFL